VAADFKRSGQAGCLAVLEERYGRGWTARTVTSRVDDALGSWPELVKQIKE
jgi:hypothetical protein